MNNFVKLISLLCVCVCGVWVGEREREEYRDRATKNIERDTI